MAKPSTTPSASHPPQLTSRKQQSKAKIDRFAKPTKFEMSVKYNKQQLTKIKDISSLSFGACCGILNLTSLNGFLFFILTNLLTTLLYYIFIVVNNGTYKGIGMYYESPVVDLVFSDLGRYLASFTMMWCLLFAMVSS